jgi:uncharacterized membrane protein
MDQQIYEEEQKQTTSAINVPRTERTISTLGGLTMVVIGLVKRGRAGAILGLIGGNLVYRGLSGVSLVQRLLGRNRAVHDEGAAISVPHQQGIRIVETITINHPVEDVYAFWRDFTNLPRFMQHLNSVDVLSETRSHWRVNGPANMTVEWDAEIINDEANRVIGWRTLENPYVDHAGSVRFKSTPDDRATEVHVTMEYAPIAGPVGAAVARLFGSAPDQKIRSDLDRLKQYLEAGEGKTMDQGMG